ncbi:type VI secretion system-associated protein TagF [Microbulbifer epialgicus]|uniref:Type VI secretion system-associated protein TagF n=1 Tax=Microbulbifer epialgicus TaxID=393907 RepID=A0ABV4NW64_9GAMM
MQNSIGIFGKLPGHGDFIQRQLPASFVSVWDEWLQRTVHGSREIMGNEWLDYYLTSPVWRFVHGKGMIDESAWAGILVPSVDSVGRYFPLTITAPLPAATDAFTFMAHEKDWFQGLSELAIGALQNMLHVDQLSEAFAPVPTGLYTAILPGPQSDFYVSSGDASGIESSYAGLLGQLCKKSFASYSLWWCEGSQHLAPTSLLCPSLPSPEFYCSMLGARQRQVAM